MGGKMMQMMDRKLLFVVVFIPFILFAQVERWVYRYDGSLDSTDFATSVIYGADGNIYAGGGSRGNSGYIDATVISLTNSGNERWVYRNSGPTIYDDVVLSIVYGSDGNIYAAGKSYGGSTLDDIIVISLTTSGSERWVYRYNSPGDHIDYAYSIVYGSDGNIYVAGASGGASAGWGDFTVISLTTSGSERWVYTYNGPGNGNDCAYSLVHGSDGNIYAAGRSEGINSLYDFAVVSLTTSGSERWVYRYNGPGNQRDCANSIVYGLDNNIYSAGYGTGSGTREDFTVISLTNSGSERWVYTHNGAENYVDVAKSLVYGSDGNLYAAGHITDTIYYDFAVVSITNSGDERWIYTYEGPANHNGEAFSIARGLDNIIYASGRVAGYHDFIIASLTSSGSEIWVYTYGGIMGGQDNKIIYGQDNNIYLAGMSISSGSREDFVVISLGGVGVEEIESFVINSGVPTIFNGFLHFPEGKNNKVFDITGREVMPDKIKPGIYFIEVDGKITQKVIKIK